MNADILKGAESTLERICRQAREHDAYVIAHPEEFTTAQVDAAKLNTYQRARLEVRDILRYS